MNDGIRLHYVDNQGGAGLTPLIIVPGLSSTAEDFARIATALIPRRFVCLSLRGRGKSDTPKSGYSLKDHAGDVASFVEDLGLKDVCVMAHSRGVPYAIAFAKASKGWVRGLILLDYPARHSKLSASWADSFLVSEYGKTAVPDKIRVEAVRAIQVQSGGELLWQEVGEFDFPVLVMRGGGEGHLLKDEDVDLYKTHLKRGQIVFFEASGHDLWNPDFNQFVRTLEDFLRDID